MSTTLVVDWSNYTGVPSPQQVADLKAAGVTGVILGTQRPTITRQQYALCQAQRLDVVGLYVFVYWHVDDRRRLAEARALAEEWMLRVWLDCEWDSSNNETIFGPGTALPMPPPAQLVDTIADYIRQLGADYFAGVYTGEWWWRQFLGNSQAFAMFPLWHAWYYLDRRAPTSFDEFRPYGGWTRPHLWQYSERGLAGVNCDLNLMERATQVPPPIDPRLVLTWEQRERYDDMEAYRLVRLAVDRGELHFVPVHDGGATLTVEARIDRGKPGAAFVVRKT
jgi:hypothetical protein